MFDRREIMLRAHREFRFWRSSGEPKDFAECLRIAWRVAKEAQRLRALAA